MLQVTEPTRQDSGQTRIAKRVPLPRRLLFFLAGSVLCAELLAILVLLALPPMSHFLEALLHWGIATGLVFLLLYVLSFHPLLAQVRKSSQIERELQQARSDLERQIEKRTAKLLAANRALLAEVAERGRAQERIRLYALQCEQAEAALEVERERLYTLLNELPAFVFLRGPDYSTRFANRQFQARFGDPAAGFCYQIIHGRPTPCDPCPAMGVLHSKRPDQWEWTLADGTSYQLHGYPFTDVDGTELVLELGIDITERKKAKAQLEQINAELRAVDQAEHRERLFAEGLVQASVALNTNLDLDGVLDRILAQTQRVILCRAAALMLFEEDRILLARSRGLDGPSEVLENLAHGVPLEALPVLRPVCLERQAVLVPDVQLAPEWRDLSGLEWIRSFASVPLIEGQQVIGLIVVVSAQPGFFTLESTKRLQAFATHAALAIQNASLFREVLAGRERLQFLSRRLVDVQESERRWIARELHDEAGQALTSLMVGLKLLEQKAGSPQAVLAATAELEQLIEAVMGNLHQLAINLRPASLDPLGLMATLRQHCASIGDSHGLAVQFETVGLEGRLPPEIEIAVYRIVQEALTNVVRHAQAASVAVILERRNGSLVTIIEDDGCGFDPAAAERTDCLGLFGMRERAHALGGTLTVESVSGVGTTIVVEVPYDDQDSHCR